MKNILKQLPMAETLTAEYVKAFKHHIAKRAIADLLVKMKSADAPDTGTFRMIISTGDMDRQGESVDQHGYDFGNYMKNPVVLWGHDYYSLPIGITDKLSIEGNQLIAEGRFAPTSTAYNIRVIE